MKDRNPEYVQSVYDVATRGKWTARLLLTPIILLAILCIYLLISAPCRLGALLWLGFLVFLALCIMALWHSDDLTSRLPKAEPASRDRHAYYINCVESLAIGAGIPCPKIYVLRDPMPNSFSWGRDPAHAKICVTTSLLGILNRQELEAVVAHEISHIASYDITLMAFVMSCAFLASAIYLIPPVDSHMPTFNKVLRSPAFWIIVGIFITYISAFSGFKVFLILWGIVIFPILLVVFRSFCMSVMPALIFRKREFLADSNARLLTRSPDGMIGALTAIKSCGIELEYVQSNLWRIMFSPHWHEDEELGFLILKKIFPHKLSSLTPTLDERISRLKAMY